MRRMVYWAFDLGITHFDLANNYGPPPGQAEAALGKSFDTSPDPSSATVRVRATAARFRSPPSWTMRGKAAQAPARRSRKAGVKAWDMRGLR
jgi:aryl-alcohol dehydrogenase-like predicted oxidoreductase